MTTEGEHSPGVDGEPRSRRFSTPHAAGCGEPEMAAEEPMQQTEPVQLNHSAMKYVRLGTSGLRVSRIALGTMTYGTPAWRPWCLDHEQSRPFYQRALESGINFFDSADMYCNGESERVMGRVFKEFGTRREDLVIATKCFYAVGNDNGPNARGLSRKHILDAIDASLERLQMPYVDLYQIHRWDNDVSAEEVMCALNDVVRSGKARYIGASSMFTWQFQHCQNVAEKNGWTKFISMQNHYNLVYREEEREMIPYCSFSGVGVIPWSPLARGFLCDARAATTSEKSNPASTLRAKTDSISDALYFSPEDKVIAERTAQLAERKGCKAAQIALAWLLHKTPVSAPIIGASKLYHLDEAVQVLKIKLDADDLRFLEEQYKPHRVLGNLTPVL